MRKASRRTMSGSTTEKKKGASMSTDDKKKVVKSDEEWKKELTPQQYEVLRHAGTERAFTGPFVNDHDPGRYVCAGCGQELFRSEDKFDSGSGWPSFTQPTAAPDVETVHDSAHGMDRTEVRCARCDGHLGHVFEDGPRPTGLRYCINGTALKKLPAK
jgi:peptide-methionine (R)-S-oxide reductase